MSHGEFLTRVQKSLYYSDNKAKMSIPLSDYIADTFSETHDGYSLNRLNYSTVGNLRSTPCSLILAMIYLERLKDADPAYTKHVTPTELFLVSMMVATKFYSGHDDEAPYVNWSECANMTPDNLLEMELSFLNAIDWKVYVSNEEFFNKVKSLEIILAQQQGMKRGFFTYLEMSSIMPSAHVAKQLIQSILVMSLSYTVLVATMVASVFLVSQIPGTYLNAPTSTTHSSANLPIRNSSLTQRIGTANMPLATNEPSESTENSSESDLDVILNLALDRLNKPSEPVNEKEQPNTTTWTSSFFSSWYSLLNIDSPQRPVIGNNWDWKYTCNEGINEHIFCNSSANKGLLSTSTSADRFKFSFNGIKLKWA
ncbi:protein CNPPD1 isoform X2 [Contarinia nasturtii]|nr:protein CNPPD1 isoform X2 [Contarinia nasturtii]